VDTNPPFPPVSPAVRVTVLAKLAGEGFEDAFGTTADWLAVPAPDLAELREAVGAERVSQLSAAVGLREGAGDDYVAGGPAGTVTLAPAARTGVLGLLGLAALPPEVLVEETPDGQRYQVPEDWFMVVPAAGRR